MDVNELQHTYSTDRIQQSSVNKNQLSTYSSASNNNTRISNERVESQVRQRHLKRYIHWTL